MKVVVVGLGQTGREVVKRLLAHEELRVVALDLREEKVGKLWEEVASVGYRGELVAFQGDGTSRLVLRSAEVEKADCVLATTGRDEVNVEVLRLAREFDVPLLLGVLVSKKHAGWFEKEGLTYVARPDGVATSIVNRVVSKIAVAKDVGLGLGEIVETEVSSSSPFAGRSLAEVKPRSWVVAMVYRGNELVVPHGGTVLRPGDRVVLAGDPAVVGDVAKGMTMREPEFPLRYGTSALVVAPKDRKEEFLSFASRFLSLTRVRKKFLCDFTGEGAEGWEEVDVSFAQALPFWEFLRETCRERDAGVLVLPSPSVFGRTLRRRETEEVVRRAECPVVFVAHGEWNSAEFLVWTEENLSPLPEIADFVRTAKVPLSLAVMEKVDGSHRELVERARLSFKQGYSVEVSEVRTFRENPALGGGRTNRSVVLAVREGKRGWLAPPEVGVELAWRSPINVVVFPTEVPHG